MGTFSPFHWLIVILVLVLLFGAKKIPDLAKSLGQGLKEFKKATKEDPDAEKKPAVTKDKAPDKLEQKDDTKA
jgi:sec-independent protein translocase protein TatA